MDTPHKTNTELDKALARALCCPWCLSGNEGNDVARKPAPSIHRGRKRCRPAQMNAINALPIKTQPAAGSVREVRRIVAYARKWGYPLDGELLKPAATLRNFSGRSQWYGLSEHEMLPTDDLLAGTAPQLVLESKFESILSPEEMA